MDKNLRETIVLLTDAYKLHHREMYPKNTITVYSNGTPRSSNHYKGNNKNEVIVFGTQRLVRKLKEDFDIFFNTDKKVILDFCKEQLKSFNGLQYDVSHLEYLHDLGKLPLVVKSLPEGSKCPIKVPYMTFYNTDPRCFWLTNYLETFISCEIWPMITNATIANEYREIFEKWSKKTVGNIGFVPFQGHDFSMRGMFGSEAARMSGLAHLTSFCGSDTVPSYLDAQHYYDSGQNNWEAMDIVATSVPATEHSVECSHYKPSDGNELAYLDHILETFPTGIVSIVCDGFDFWEFITKVLPLRKEKIMSRDGKVVVRPDSGSIVHIITGWDKNEMKQKHWDNYSKAEKDGAIITLYNIFGGSENEKGFIELDPHIGLIYGDSVTLQIANEVCERLAHRGFASTNWVAGIGSFTYQFNTRDSHGQAIKATYIESQHAYFDENGEVDGFDIVGKNIFKDPKTGDGLKKSAKGLLSVFIDYDTDGQFLLMDEMDWEMEKAGELKEIWVNGELKNQVTLQQIRKNIKK